MIRRKRHALRKQGLTLCEINALEEVALLMRGQKIRIIRGSYLAAALGVSAQHANKLLRRLAALDLITRFKTGLMRLNTEKLNEISVTAAKTVRRKVSKWLKQKSKSACRNHGVLNKDISKKQGAELPLLARKEALNALRATYVPVHLRKTQ